MADIEISKTIDTSVEAVWAELEQIEAHSEWMTDAVSIRFDGDQRRGRGTRISVETKVGPLRTLDRMEFVRWEPQVAMGVRHRGLVRGVGEFTLTRAGDDATVLTWREALEFPWFLGGPIGAWLAKPILTRIWRRNLATLAARL